MQVRRILRAVFGIAALLLICAYFYMRVEQFPRDRTHNIWIIAMLCSWVSVFAAWREKANKDS